MDLKKISLTQDPAQGLAAVVALRRLADDLERRAVNQAIGQGWSWALIAQALGVSKQAAHKRLASVISSKQPTPGGIASVSFPQEAPE